MRAAGFRLDIVFPADEPHTAFLSGPAGKVRLTKPGAPSIPAGLPAFAPEFVLTAVSTTAAQGRAGMLYRDLIPGRLGGRYIASHITIPDGVADWVHYHRVAVQMILVRRGWVRVVYEGQGAPFVMSEGDLVLQPPGIRHRVLESSAGLEVIEISAPALHETLADRAIQLPTIDRSDRSLSGQRFLRHVGAEAAWTSCRGAEVQETDMFEATGGLADVSVFRRGSAREIAFRPHDGELVFGFVLEGKARLDRGEGFGLNAADAFVIPPSESWAISEMTADFRLLHVTTAALDAAAPCPL